MNSFFEHLKKEIRVSPERIRIVWEDGVRRVSQHFNNLKVVDFTAAHYREVQNYVRDYFKKMKI